MLAVSGTAPASQVSLVLIVLLKGVEHACLGSAHGWIGQRPWGGALARIAAGLAMGVIFGGAIVSITYSAAPEPLSAGQVISMGVNEFIFPVGCSLVLYVAAAAARWQTNQPDASQTGVLARRARRGKLGSWITDISAWSGGPGWSGPF